MLVATWVLAIATAILALSGPIALTEWRNARKRDRESEMEKRIMQSAKDTFVSKGAAAGIMVIAGVLCLFAWSAWEDRRNGKQ